MLFNISLLVNLFLFPIVIAICLYCNYLKEINNRNKKSITSQKKYIDKLLKINETNKIICKEWEKLYYDLKEILSSIDKEKYNKSKYLN